MPGSFSKRFPRQEYWSGLPFPSPRDLPDPGIEPVFLALAGSFFTADHQGSPITVLSIPLFQGQVEYGSSPRDPSLSIQHVKALNNTEEKAEGCQISEAAGMTGTLVAIKSQTGVKIWVCSCA